MISLGRLASRGVSTHKIDFESLRMSPEQEFKLGELYKKDFRAFIELGWTLRNEFSQYKDLVKLAEVLSDCVTTQEKTVEFTILSASIFSKIALFDLASDILYDAARTFPGQTEILYSGALNSLDGGHTRRARDFIEQLSMQASELSEQHLRGLIRVSSLSGLHGIAEAAYDVAVKKGFGYPTPHLRERISAATINSRRFEKSPLRIVSAGENCLPWMVLNRWGLRADPSDANLDTIFNLAQTSTDGCTKIIASGVGNLIAPHYLVVSANANGTPLPENSMFGFSFNHEQGQHWVDNNFSLLHQRYAPRIENFQSHAAGGARIFVHYTDREGDLEAFVSALKGFNRDINYRIVLIDLLEGDRAAPLQDERVHYLRMSLPRPDYTWFKPDDYDSVEGVEFERAIVDVVLSAGRALS